MNEIEIFAKELAAIKLFFELNSIPNWIKEVKLGIPDEQQEFRMLALNEQYHLDFLEPFNIPRRDYIGRTDSEFWVKWLGEEKGLLLAENYRYGDLIALKDGWFASEELNPDKPREQRVFVLKTLNLSGTQIDSRILPAADKERAMKIIVP